MKNAKRIPFHGGLHHRSESLRHQRPTPRPVPQPLGLASGYSDAAKLCVQMGAADFLADPDRFEGLYEAAVVAAEESWEIESLGVRHEALGHDWLASYSAGMRCFLADLKVREDDEAAEARLLAAGVMP